MKKGIFLLLLLLLAKFCVFGQVPVDNPFNTRYHIKGHWTDSLPWNNVIKADTVAGLIDDTMHVDSAVLAATMKTLSQAGGGVIYFKAGTYYFDYTITLYDHIIFRGADPGPVKDATNDNYRPPTKFSFPRYIPSFHGSGTSDNLGFKQILDTSNINFGMVNLDLNRANIFAYQENKKNIIIFGIRSNNAIDKRSIFLANAKGRGWERYPNTSVGNIYVTFTKGVVANCRINDSITDDWAMPDFMTNDGRIFHDTAVKFQFGLQDGVYINNYGIIPGYLDLLDNYVKACYISRIGDNYLGYLNKSGNKFITLPCQDLVDADYYSRENLVQTDKAFKKKIFICEDKDTLTYYILEPKNYDPKKKYPFVLFLHGRGQHGSNDPLMHYVFLYSRDSTREKYPYFVVVPHIKENEEFSTSMAKPPTKSLVHSIDLAKAIEKIFSIDSSRTYIAGISSGGVGVIEAIVRYPGMFKTAIIMSALRPLTREQVGKITHTNLIISAGTDDWDTPIATARNAASFLKGAGVNVHFFEYDNVSHWSWVTAGADSRFLNLIFK